MVVIVSYYSVGCNTYIHLDRFFEMTIINGLLEPNEVEIIDILADAWNKFLKLKVLHPNDTGEFLQAIHAAQNIVMSRPVAREMYQKDEPMEKVS